MGCLLNWTVGAIKQIYFVTINWLNYDNQVNGQLNYRFLRSNPNKKYYSCFWNSYYSCYSYYSYYQTQVEAPDRKSICPDRPRRKVSMSRPSQTESAYVQTFVRSKFFVHSSCVQNSLCPDFRAFKILYDQTLVRSKLKFVRSFVRSKTPMSRLSCVQTCFCPDFRAFKILYD